jgi:ketosteroid isomerase-like protein
MSIEANRALVLRFYELMSHMAFDAMFALTSDDAIWTVAGNPALFHHSGAATKAQRAATLANFTKAFASVQQTVVSTTAEADRVVAELHTRCVTHGGLVYENDLMVLIRCREGRIVSLYEHLDQATTLDFEARMAAA